MSGSTAGCGTSPRRRSRPELRVPGRGRRTGRSLPFAGAGLESESRGPEPALAAYLETIPPWPSYASVKPHATPGKRTARHPRVERPSMNLPASSPRRRWTRCPRICWRRGRPMKGWRHSGRPAPHRERVPVPGCTRDGCAGWYAAGNQQGREAAATGSGKVAPGFAIESRG